MKIGYLVKTIDSKNGAGRYAFNIIEGVKKAGHSVVIAKEVDDSLDGYPILRRGPSMFLNLLKLKKIFQGCDVIHAIDGYPYGIVAWLVNITLHKKLIISALGTYAVAPLYRWQTFFLLSQAYKSAYRVIAISNFTKQEIIKKVKLGNIEVITPGIEVNNASMVRQTANVPFLLGVGAIKERKGYHIALEAFAMIVKEFPSLKYKIVADPDIAFQTILDKVIREHDLFGKVEFLHGISEEELQGLYRSAEIFVLTPINTEDHHFEGFGLVYLEAARAGLPVVGSLNCGAEDAVKDGYNGILVEQNDGGATAEAMRSILFNQEKKQGMRSASNEWAKLNSIEVEIKKFLHLYQTLENNN